MPIPELPLLATMFKDGFVLDVTYIQKQHTIKSVIRHQTNPNIRPSVRFFDLNKMQSPEPVFETLVKTYIDFGWRP